MNDEEVAKKKTSMKITDGQLVSWGTVKGTILNYIKKYLPSAIPNTNHIIMKLENDYSLSGRSQSDIFKYRNSVSGIINKLSGKAQDWPSSSVFSYIKGNKVILVTLAGIIEYNQSDIKHTPKGEVYINNANAHLFNGANVNISICPTTINGLTQEQLKTGNFNCSDIRLFPSVPENTKIKNIQDIKKLTTYEILFKNTDGSNKYYFSNDLTDGISISNLDDDNVFSGSLSYKNDTASNNKDIEIYEGKFINFMPGDEKAKIIYHEIDGQLGKHILRADGCGGICKDDDLSIVNLDYFINDFITNMSDYGGLNDNSISEISNQFRLSLANMQKGNIDERESDNETGDRYNIIHTSRTNREQCFYEIKSLFNGKYVKQIIQYDENGNYLIAEQNLNRSASDNIYEVQLGNGKLFIGQLNINNRTGEVYFAEGKFFNQEGKVIDNKTQISLQDASSLLFTDARKINENDLKEFQDSDRIIIEKGENGYDFTIIGTSFENTIKNDKLFSNYLPTFDYIEKQIKNVEEFLTTEMKTFNNTGGKIYNDCIKIKDEEGFSNKLIGEIRKCTKKLYAKTRKNTYVLSDGKKITQDRLSAFYSQLSKWQYLYRMKCKRQELDGNNIKNKTQNNDVIIDNKMAIEIPILKKNNTNTTSVGDINNNTDITRSKENIGNDKIVENKLKKNNTNTTSVGDMKDNTEIKEYQETNRDNNNNTGNTITSPTNKNLLKQPQNGDNINETRYPKILNHSDIIAIFYDPYVRQITNASPEKRAILSHILKNVIDTENEKINLFINTCKLLHMSRGNVCKNGAKVLILSRAEYEEFMKLNNRLTASIKEARKQELYKQVQSYHIEITDNYDDIKDDFHKPMQFALSGEEKLNKALHAKNCKLFDELDKTGEIKRCCNDVLYERDVNGENINQEYSGYYNAYENQDSLNEVSNFNLDAAPYTMVDSSII